MCKRIGRWLTSEDALDNLAVGFGVVVVVVIFRYGFLQARQRL